MNTNKFLVGGIVGGIAFFFLGWLVWGNLLLSFMNEHSNQASGVFRSMEDMIWWAMIVSNLCLGFLISYVIGRAGIKGAMAGATAGAVVGLLASLGTDLSSYALANLMDMTAIVVDVVAAIVVSGIVGAIIGWLYGRGAAKTA